MRARLLTAMLGAFSLVTALSAQSFTASIRGVVTDATQAVVPAAKVVATVVDRNLPYTARTDAMGRYLITPLPPGNYSLTVEAAGFDKFAHKTFALAVQQAATVDVQLLVGSVATAVDVSAQSPLLNMSNAEMGQVIEHSYIRDIPLVDRDFIRLVYLAAGVVPINTDPGGANMSNPTNFVSNGARSGISNIYIDGGLATSIEKNNAGGKFLEMEPSVESLDEFKVQTNYLPAEYGNSGGTAVNIVSKSGTNTFHGTVFEYYRNADLNANSFFAKRAGSASLPAFSLHRFGGGIGGPVSIPKVYSGKNRTFFYTTLDINKSNGASTSFSTVPTARERSGDFSDTRNQQGQLFTVYNPFSTTTSANGTVLRDPFPNNIIPASMLNPIALKAVSYYPNPTSTGLPFTHVNNFFAQGTGADDTYQGIAKVDQILSGKDRIAGRYAREAYRNHPFLPWGDSVATSVTGFNSDTHQASLQFIRTHNPTTVFTVRYSLEHQNVENFLFSRGFDVASLGLPAILKTSGVQEFPTFSISGYDGLGAKATAGATSSTTTQAIMYSMNKILGAHAVKMGGESVFYKLNGASFSSPVGSFTFNAAATGQNPLLASNIQGNSIASLLVGWGSGGSYGIFEQPASASRYHGWYIEDDWKVSRKLTLNLGLRYDFEQPRTERYDRLSWFDPSMASPINGQVSGYNLRGGLRFADSNTRSPFDSDRNNIQPRIGFAYALNKHTSIRGGYGIYYSMTDTIATLAFGAPFAVNTSIQWSRDSNITPYASLSNPFPDGITLPAGKDAGAATFLGLGLSTVLRQNQNPQYQQWAFSVQHQLPKNSVLEINYAGTKGTHLYFSGLGNLNLLDPSYWNIGRTALSQQVTNPFYGVITNSVSALSAKTVSRQQLLLGYPQYTGLSVAPPTIANSIYHSLQVKYEHRFMHGLSAMLNYTWSKMIDDSSNSGYSFFGGSTPVQNIFSLRNERSLSALDVASRAVASFTYELPFGHGRLLGKGWNRALNFAAGGWMASGVTIFQDGYPVVIGLASSNLLAGTQRPNLIGDPSMPGSVRDRLNGYFNLNAFSRPVADTYGSAPRTLNYRTPGIANADLTLGKKFPLRERRGVFEFRMEAFNALNGVTFAAPNASFGGTTFGQITDYLSGFSPRVVQFAVRYDF